MRPPPPPMRSCFARGVRGGVGVHEGETPRGRLGPGPKNGEGARIRHSIGRGVSAHHSAGSVFRTDAAPRGTRTYLPASVRTRFSKTAHNKMGGRLGQAAKEGSDTRGGGGTLGSTRHPQNPANEDPLDAIRSIPQGNETQDRIESIEMQPLKRNEVRPFLFGRPCVVFFGGGFATSEGCESRARDWRRIFGQLNQIGAKTTNTFFCLLRLHRTTRRGCCV